MPATPPFATLDDLLDALAAGRACELIAGDLIEPAAPDTAHERARHALLAALGPVLDPAGDRHGEWWLRPDVEIRLFTHVVRPDVSGWRRARVPAVPPERPLVVVPDWVCEVLSPQTAARDYGIKRDLYHRAGVDHYWIVDCVHRLLLLYRNSPAGYVLIASATEQDTLYAEPFDHAPFFVGVLFGLDAPEDDAA